MVKMSDTKLNALRSIANGAVYVRNDGKTDTMGVPAQAVRSLRREGYVTVNGASRRTVNGRSARRLVLTPRGRNTLTV